MSALLQGFLLIGPALQVATAFICTIQTCAHKHTQIPSDAHMHMLATDYPWTYLLEDIPASQSFTANQRDRRTKWISELKCWACLSVGSYEYFFFFKKELGSQFAKRGRTEWFVIVGREECEVSMG